MTCFSFGHSLYHIAHGIRLSCFNTPHAYIVLLYFEKTYFTAAVNKTKPVWRASNNAKPGKPPFGFATHLLFDGDRLVYHRRTSIHRERFLTLFKISKVYFTGWKTTTKMQFSLGGITFWSLRKTGWAKRKPKRDLSCTMIYLSCYITSATVVQVVLQIIARNHWPNSENVCYSLIWVA